MTPKDPFLEGTSWDKFWRPIRSRALLLTPESETGRKRFRGVRLQTPNSVSFFALTKFREGTQ